MNPELYQLYPPRYLFVFNHVTGCDAVKSPNQSVVRPPKRDACLGPHASSDFRGVQTHESFRIIYEATRWSKQDEPLRIASCLVTSEKKQLARTAWTSLLLGAFQNAICLSYPFLGSMQRTSLQEGRLLRFWDLGMSRRKQTLPGATVKLRGGLFFRLYQNCSIAIHD